MQESCALQRGTVGGVLASGVLQMEWNVYLTLIKNLGECKVHDQP